MKKILITGISGFVGHHLAALLSTQQENHIIGTSLSPELHKKEERYELHKINLLEKEQVSALISQIRPDYVYHLAALSSPKQSFSSPEETLMNNVNAQLYLLEALRLANLMQTKVLVVSSADIYGHVLPNQLPMNENTFLRPTNPYAVSKITQDFLGLQYFLAYNMPILRVRPFNHIGPGQSPHFVIASFAKQIAAIEKGKQDPILKVGNLEAKRDFTDVRDIVKAYVLLMEKGTVGEVYNVGSGTSHAIGEVLHMLIALSKVPITLSEDVSLLRPIDDPELVCDNSKIKKEIGWEPSISLEQTLEDTLAYWREQAL